MIAITRPANPPAVLKADSDTRIDAEAAIQAIIDAGNNPTSKQFAKLWGKKPVRTALWTMQNLSLIHI